jgi:hypothetical protein
MRLAKRVELMLWSWLMNASSKEAFLLKTTEGRETKKQRELDSNRNIRRIRL